MAVCDARDGQRCTTKAVKGGRSGMSAWGGISTGSGSARAGSAAMAGEGTGDCASELSSSPQFPEKTLLLISSRAGRLEEVEAEEAVVGGGAWTFHQPSTRPQGKDFFPTFFRLARSLFFSFTSPSRFSQIVSHMLCYPMTNDLHSSPFRSAPTSRP